MRDHKKLNLLLFGRILEEEDHDGTNPLEGDTEHVGKGHATLCHLVHATIDMTHDECMTPRAQGTDGPGVLPMKEIDMDEQDLASTEKSTDVPLGVRYWRWYVLLQYFIENFQEML